MRAFNGKTDLRIQYRRQKIPSHSPCPHARHVTRVNHENNINRAAKVIHTHDGWAFMQHHHTQHTQHTHHDWGVDCCVVHMDAYGRACVVDSPENPVHIDMWCHRFWVEDDGTVITFFRAHKHIKCYLSSDGRRLRAMTLAQLAWMAAVVRGIKSLSSEA